MNGQTGLYTPSAVEQDGPNYTMTINNKEVWQFFNENPTIDFETAVLITIDILDMTMKNASTTINNAMHTKILSLIGEQTNQIKQLKTDVAVMKNDLCLKFIEIEKEYIQDVKTIITNNNNVSTEKISALLEKSNTLLLDKTYLVLNDVIPKSHDTYGKQLEHKIKLFHRNMLEEMIKLMETKPSEFALNEFLSNFENKTTTLLQTVQQPIYSYIASTEERLSKSVNQIKEQSMNREPIFDTLGEFLNKSRYRNSTAKGKFSEAQLEEILNQLFPSCLVKNTSTTPESGDFILQQRELGKPDILFENKDYTLNVNSDEVEKFLRDVSTQNCHGILISQSSGIVNKRPYQIEIHNNYIVVYILNCGYDPDKVKVAIDIIDTIASCLSANQLANGVSKVSALSNELLEQINTEYSKFVAQKLALIDTMKTMCRDMTRRVVTQVEEIKFPSLSSFLAGKFGNYSSEVAPPSQEGRIMCNICNIFQAKNAISLAAHRKGCAKKNTALNADGEPIPEPVNIPVYSSATRAPANIPVPPALSALSAKPQQLSLGLNLSASSKLGKLNNNK